MSDTKKKIEQFLERLVFKIDVSSGEPVNSIEYWEKGKPVSAEEALLDLIISERIDEVENLPLRWDTEVHGTRLRIYGFSNKKRKDRLEELNKMRSKNG